MWIALFGLSVKPMIDWHFKKVKLICLLFFRGVWCKGTTDWKKIATQKDRLKIIRPIVINCQNKTARKLSALRLFKMKITIWPHRWWHAINWFSCFQEFRKILKRYLRYLPFDSADHRVKCCHAKQPMCDKIMCMWSAAKSFTESENW